MSDNWWDKIDFDKLTPEELKMVHDHISRAHIVDVDLPHRTRKFYGWQKEFWDCKNTQMFLTAGNQVGKSEIQIRRDIERAGNKNLWKGLWETTPTHGWYMYPDKTTLDIEFNQKWVNLLPGRTHILDKRSDFYWRRFPRSDAKQIEAIEFGSGYTIYFFTYTKRPTTLQAQSVFQISTDEELPIKHYEELQFRLSATKGYFSMAFTATLGQELWRRTMQPEQFEEEQFPGAWKKSVSQYDCMYFDDGTPGIYTPEMIADNIRKCSSQAEVQRRVFGRFVVDSDRLVPTFDAKRHVIAKSPIPDGWQVRGAVDLGSGGAHGHPAAILFLATDPKPKPTRGKFFLGWKGTAGYETTSGDVYERYARMRDGNSLKPIRQIYDYESAEFRIVASRHHDPFVKANKNRDEGIPLLNTLFQHDALEIMLDPELGKLISECTIAKPAKSKTSKTGDDLVDTARYLVMDVLWDLPLILSGVCKKEKEVEQIRAVSEKISQETAKNMDNPEKIVEKEEDFREKQRREQAEWYEKQRKEGGMYADEFEEINSNLGY